MLAVLLAHASELPADFADLARWSWQPGELQRCARISHDGRRLRFLAGRHLARRLLAEHLGGAPFDWALQGEAGQAPIVPARPDLHLSVSHSGPWLVCALSDRSVGVDVEAHKPARDLPGIAAVAFDSGLCTQLANMEPSEQGRLFTLNWTLREAWLKRAGLGLDLALMRSLHAQPVAAGCGNAFAWTLPETSCLSLVADSAVDCQFFQYGMAAFATKPSDWQIGRSNVAAASTQAL